MRIDAEAERSQRIERGSLALRPIFAVDEQKVREEDQPAIGDDAGLERAQRSGGGVARIDGGRQPLALALFIHAQEGGFAASRLRRALQRPAGG